MDYLAKLERNEIAKLRVIKGVAVKPRLRIMSEVVAEANPHRYTEIGERTINLILQAPSEDSNQTCKDWILKCFRKEKLAVCVLSDTLRVADGSGCDMKCRIFTNQAQVKWTSLGGLSCNWTENFQDLIPHYVWIWTDKRQARKSIKIYKTVPLTSVVWKEITTEGWTIWKRIFGGSVERFCKPIDRDSGRGCAWMTRS